MCFTSGQNSLATLPSRSCHAAHFGASYLELRQSVPKWLTAAKLNSFAELAAFGHGILIAVISVFQRLL